MVSNRKSRLSSSMSSVEPKLAISAFSSFTTSS